MRYFHVDRILELKPLEYAVGVKCISLSDDAFEHHFPGQPVYPGALLVESMAQLGGALLELSLAREGEPCPRCVLSSVKAKFLRFVEPGDRLELRAEVVSHHECSALVRVVVRNDEERVARGELLYVILQVDDPLLEASRREYLDVLTRKMRLVE